jgi:hypothetical protein
MIFKKIHFPIFVVLVLSIFISCNKKIENPKNENHNLSVEKAVSFYNKQDYDSAYYYFYKASDACSEIEKERKVYENYQKENS